MVFPGLCTSVGIKESWRLLCKGVQNRTNALVCMASGEEVCTRSALSVRQVQEMEPGSHHSCVESDIETCPVYSLGSESFVFQLEHLHLGRITLLVVSLSLACLGAS